MLTWNDELKKLTRSFKEGQIISDKKMRKTSAIYPQQSHTQESKQYCCSICEKYFSTTAHLNDHVSSIHENNRPFKCTYVTCEKGFACLSRLKAHIRIHDNIKPYTCNLCGKSFNEKGNLKTHLRCHSQERPFKCPQCEKNYKTNGHLKDHMVIYHMEIKNFICPLCNKKFGKCSSLKIHTRIHTKEKPFQCPLIICGKRFSEKGNMQTHYRRHLEKQELKGGDISLGSISNLIRRKENPAMHLTICSSKMRPAEKILEMDKTISFEINFNERNMRLLNFGQLVENKSDECQDDFSEDCFNEYKCNRENDVNDKEIRVELQKWLMISSEDSQ